MIRRNRLSFEDHFVQIPNAWMRDKRISWRARGVLAYLMTHAPGWEESVRSLAAVGDAGRDAMGAVVRELEDAGYLVRQRVRDTSGQLGGTEWELQDPFEGGRISRAWSASAGSACAGESGHTEEHLPEHHVSEHEKPSSSSGDDGVSRPVGFEEWWEAYPRKVGKEAARKAFVKALKLAWPSDLLEAVKRYAADPNLPEKRFIPHPATWLNGGRWGDEAQADRPVTDVQTDWMYQ